MRSQVVEAMTRFLVEKALIIFYSVVTTMTSFTVEKEMIWNFTVTRMR